MKKEKDTKEYRFFTQEQRNRLCANHSIEECNRVPAARFIRTTDSSVTTYLVLDLNPHNQDDLLVLSYLEGVGYSMSSESLKELESDQSVVVDPTFEGRYPLSVYLEVLDNMCVTRLNDYGYE